MEALDGLDRLSAASNKRVALVLDEFQQVVEAGGVEAEGQVRAAVQRHDHVAYVFAGSKTTLLAEMTGSPSRPFYRLGARLFVGAIPRADFRPFLQRRLEGAGRPVSAQAVEAILAAAAAVPYNVQRLAHACYEALRDAPEGERPKPWEAADVARVLDALVARDDPFYTQVWNGLTGAQQKALLALTETGGTGLYAREVLAGYALGLSTMRRSLDARVRTGLAREDEVRGTRVYRLEAPFLGHWLRLFLAAL